MRPSKVRENSPFEDLPLLQSTSESLSESQPTLPSPEVSHGGCGVNVPWPHFQDIPYHVTWGSANEDAGPIDEFIEMQGRWMTKEEEEEVMKFSRPRGARVEAQVVVEDEEADDADAADDDDDDDAFKDDFEVKDALDEEDDKEDDDEDEDEDDDDMGDDELDDDDDDEEEDEDDLDDMLGF